MLFLFGDKIDTAVAGPSSTKIRKLAPSSVPFLPDCVSTTALARGGPALHERQSPPIPQIELRHGPHHPHHRELTDLSQFTRAVLGLLGAASLAAALPPVTVKGNYFVNNVTGDRFQIAGVAYQPGGSSAYSPNSGQDPLSDKSVCLRDVAIMQALGVNAIRVYSVNPDLNHDDCVSILNAVCCLLPASKSVDLRSHDV